MTTLPRLVFTIPGPPVPWRAPKVVSRPGMKYPIATPHAKTVGYETHVCGVAFEAIQQHPQKAIFPLEGPIKLTLVIYVPRPKSTPKKILFPMKRPDSTNLLKAIEDGISKGGVWGDDSQVCEHQVSRRFDPIPRVEVQVDEILSEHPARV